MFTVDTFELQTYWKSAKQYILGLLLQDLPYFSIISGTVMVSIFPDLGEFLTDSKIHFISESDRDTPLKTVEICASLGP